MDKENTILRIKKIEENGKKQVEGAEIEAEKIVSKSREKSLELVQTFDANRDTYIREKIKKAETSAKIHTKKIISSAESDAKKLKTSADKKIKNVVDGVFEQFKKELPR